MPPSFTSLSRRSLTTIVPMSPTTTTTTTTTNTTTTTTTTTTRLRFAPLSPTAPPTTAPKLRGIIFDVDGTLTLPQPWMFTAMRDSLRIPAGVDILTHIASLPSPSAATAAMEAIQAIETRAMAEATLQPGLRELMRYLDSRGMRKAILTRNYEAPVRELLARPEMQDLKEEGFSPVVTRAFLPTKPRPEGIRHICGLWGVATEDVLMVGDSIDDMAAGRAAGSVTVLVRNEGNAKLGVEGWADCVVDRLDELAAGLERGLEEVVREKKGGGGGGELR